MSADAVIDVRAPLDAHAAAVRAAGPDYRDVFRRSPVAMAIVDDAGRIVELNPAAEQLLGSDPGALRGRRLQDLAAPDDPGPLRLGTTERRLRHARGHDLWVVASAVELDGGVRQTLVCLDDATARRNTERLLLHAALHDSLTNLPNRRLLRDRLDTALARAERSGSTVAVLFLDLDGFKDVNDSYGHDAGDEVLVAVAAALHGAMRACDTVARLGGDEFVVVCEDVDEEHDVTRLAQRLVEEIERPINVHGQAVRVRTSIGIAVAGSPAGSGDELLRSADLAMLRAKQLPGTAYVFFDADADRPSVPGERLGRGDLLADLRHAIQADLLALHYQPVVHVQGGLLGLEALVRWPHPDLGLLLPEDFLPRVVGTDLARPLTDWVLRTAIRDAAEWQNPRVRVSVNVWAGEAARPGFSDTVALLLDWAGLAPRGLYLEIREHDLPDGGPGLADELDRLRRLGVGLAVDDFGSGGTSLAGLRHLPVDTLKVHRSFVAGVLRDRDDNALLAAVATAALAAGRHPLATGVETVEQLAAVRAMGYESVQGYLAGPPQPLVDLRDTIRTRVVDLGGR